MSKKIADGYFIKYRLLHIVWGNMKSRCYNKNNKEFSNYGGRGIVICEEWKNSSRAFISWALCNGWKKGLLLDRERNDEGYNPNNCRFVTLSISNLNRRRKKDTTSGYTGVRLRKDGSWRVFIDFYCKRTRFDGFNNKEEAVEARNRIIRLFDLPHKIQEVV